MKNTKVDVKKIISIAIAVLLVAAHAGMILLVSRVIRYYAIYPQLFNYIIIILICIFVIIDIVFVVGFVNKDMIQKAICLVMSIMIVVGSFVGSNLMSKTNEIVDNVVQTGENSQYETVNGLFVTYDQKYESIQTVSDLSKFSSIKIGGLDESGTDGITSIGLETLKENGVSDYTIKEFSNNTDLLFALIGGDVDVAIFSSMYKAIFRADENVDYTQYLDEMHEFGEFDKSIEVASNKSNKNLSKDPFNVLLIGWSPIEGSTTVGLADAIIVATVNPQTYTVSMMSIARDSYVPISCYGGTCDKINSGRGTSMDCFVSTVETLINDDIDFYMEINFAGFALLVDCIGGVEINNPVNFELDGTYVPAGQYVATGWQTLQFARERHHMPNGDFDRQQHQKEVIMLIAKAFLKHDIAFALDVFDEISPFLNTNLTFNQLSSVFGMITNTKNYTGLSTFNMLDMHALRVTGYGSWHYNDSYELPLWIYKLYDGSISESLEHMSEVKGNYKKISQDTNFSFDVANPYVREAFFSLEYDEVETHEELPPYYINLTTMTYQEALAWAASKGATLIPTFIDEDSGSYDEALDGYVVAQGVAYGKKVSKYPTCSVTVMGSGKKKVTPPDYEGWTLEQAVYWCKENEVSYSKVVKYVAKSENYKTEEVVKMSYDKDAEIMYITYAYTCGDNSTINADGTGCTCATDYIDDGTGSCKLAVKVPNLIGKTKDEASKALSDKGLVLGEVSQTYNSDTSTKDKVIGQSIATDTSVVKGTKVNVTISLGQKDCGDNGIPDGSGTCTICEYGKAADGKSCKLSPADTCTIQEGGYWNGTSCEAKVTCSSENHQVDNGNNTCSCEEGYSGDGSTCTLIEKTEDPPESET